MATGVLLLLLLSTLVSVGSAGLPPPPRSAVVSSWAEIRLPPRPLAPSSPALWTRLNLDGGPTTNLSLFSVAYDTSDGFDLMFGGVDSLTYTAVNTTFKYAGGHWTQLSPANAPPPLSEGALAYDPQLGGVVLFGGYTAAFSSNATWLYKDGNWTELALTGVSPPARAGGSLVYDAADGYLVLFGGGDYYTYPFSNFSDTWKLTSNGTWIQLHPQGSPPACSASAVDYDPVARLVYDFSGFYYNQSSFQADCTPTTWSYASGVWTNLTASSAPPARSEAAFTFDPALNASVLYGGMNFTNSGTVFDDVWELSSGAWSELNASAPPHANAGSPLSYDPTSGFLVLTEGVEPFTGGGSIRANTWLFDDFAVGPISSSASSAHPEVGVALTFRITVPAGGGEYVYNWSGPPGCPSVATPTWSCTPHSIGNFAVRANVTNVYLLIRMSDALNLSVVSALGTPVLSITPTALDPNQSAQLSLVGSGGEPPYAYSWSGLPPGCVVQSTANLTCLPTSPGTYSSIVGNVTDANGATRRSTAGTLTVFGAVGLSALLAHPATVDIGRTSTLAVEAHGGSGAYQYAWSGLPAGCTPTDSAAFPCIPTVSGSFGLGVTVTDSVGGEAQATATLVVAPYPAVSLSLSPPFVDAGEPITLSASTTGGVGNFTFAFTGLPSGCSSGTHPIVLCSPSSPGTYTLGVSATDSEGLEVRASSVRLTIAGALGLAQVVTPTPVPLGSSVTISLQLSGGAGPYSYSYSGLPPGCASLNASTLTCTPRAAGNYTGSASVRDASGAERNATFYVIVQSPAKRGTSTPWLLAAGGAAVVVAALLAVLLLRRRRLSRMQDWSEPEPDASPPEPSSR